MRTGGLGARLFTRRTTENKANTIIIIICARCAAFSLPSLAQDKEPLCRQDKHYNLHNLTIMKEIRAVNYSSRSGQKAVRGASVPVSIRRSSPSIASYHLPEQAIANNTHSKRSKEGIPVYKVNKVSCYT